MKNIWIYNRKLTYFKNNEFFNMNSKSLSNDLSKKKSILIELQYKFINQLNSRLSIASCS